MSNIFEMTILFGLIKRFSIAYFRNSMITFTKLKNIHILSLSGCAFFKNKRISFI